jgi:hypothetical protein
VDELDAAQGSPPADDGPEAPPPSAPPIAQRRVRTPRMGVRWLLVVAVVVAAVAVPIGVLHSRPARVELMGDSLMLGAAPDVSTDLGLEGDRVDASLAVDGAGLLDNSPDWLDKARTVVARFDPDIVVVEYVGNYGTFGGPIPGVTVYSPAFFRDWAVRSQRLEDILTSRGATVYWVIGPPIAPRVAAVGVQRLDAIYEHLRAPAGGRPPLIDITGAVTGGTGRYRLSLPGPGGRPIPVHRPDGVHFTRYGDALMARAIAQAIT